MSDPSKLDALIQKTHSQQGPCYTKVLRVNMCRSIISLNKITKCGMTKKAMGMEVGGKMVEEEVKI